MIYIGNHLSISNGYPAMARAAQALGGDCFAFFTRNPRGGKSRTPSAEETAELLELVRENGFGPAGAHGAYTMNLCAAAGETRRKGYEMLRDDLIRMKSLPGMFYNFHPGSHVGQGTEKGIALIVEALNGAIRESGNEDTVILLETPNDDEGYRGEIARVRQWREEKEMR
ncbi:TIM barrel protein [Lachnoclostridium sp. Marseille-P6806]|uniref:TIM barrel protein n=1 Tax=Lachnoclostridium sp. Marseille-P6806 TaxID=2364793 RepID=UPI0013EEEAB4|nr:TIM barrel protein [Lachnoclostridium sp. Marseille-P6806]